LGQTSYFCRWCQRKQAWCLHLPLIHTVPIESLRAEKTLFVRREKTFISSLSERRSVIVWMIYYTPVRDMNRSYFWLCGALSVTFPILLFSSGKQTAPWNYNLRSGRLSAPWILPTNYSVTREPIRKMHFYWPLIDSDCGRKTGNELLKVAFPQSEKINRSM